MATITIKNISGGVLNLLASSLIIQNIGAIAINATVSVNSPQFEFWEDATISNALNANQIEIYFGGQIVSKPLAQSLFDRIQTFGGFQAQRTVNTAVTYTPTSFDQQIFCDCAAAVGTTVTIGLVDPATQPNKAFEFVQTTAGTMAITCFVASSFQVLGANIANITTNRVGDVIRVVSNGVKWVFIQTQSMYGAAFLGPRDAPATSIATITATLDNWNVLTANPTKSRFLINSNANRNVTGMTPRDPTKSELVSVEILPGSTGNFTFQQNNSGSAVGSRFLSPNRTVSAGDVINFKYTPAPSLGWVLN